MNGSRSNTPNYGGKPSLDQLNRTIEGLEARIQGLMGEKSSARASTRNPVDEIIERQRSLGVTRDRVSAVMERSRPELTRYEAPRYAEPQQPAASAQATWERPAPRIAEPDPAIAEIAATLAALRNELHHGLGDSLQGGLSELRNEMRSLKAAAAAPAGGLDDIRGDLATLSASLDRLESSSRNMDTRHLRADLDELRAMVATAAREESLRGLEARFANTERAVAAFNPDALREELVQLAWRIDNIKTGLGEMSAAPSVKALEEKLLAVANAVEMLGRNMQGQNAIAEQFTTLDLRLDEISRAIAASARQPAGSVFDGSAIQRLENRIEDLVEYVGAMQTANPADDLSGRIEALTARIEEMATEEAARKLEERLAQLSGIIERNFREGAAPAAFTGHLEDISRKIDGLGTGNAEELIARLDMLSRRLDHMEMPVAAAAPASLDTSGMSRLESRLADIAARLDETSTAPAADQNALKNLEKQIANLSSLLNQPGAAMPAMAAPDGFGERMAAIEDYIASSDEFIVEAARQAAETVVEAYSRNGLANQQGVNASEMQALSGLAEDLRALEAHTRSSEERTAATFEALHETLVQIAGRLNDIGTTPTVERVVERSVPAAEPVRESRERLHESVAMPRAPQPDFAHVDLLADDPQPRRAPQNSKVDVLDEAEVSGDQETEADDVVEAAPAPMAARAEKKPSKSLIAGLAAKLKGARQPKPAKDARVSVEPAPALDPGDAVVSAEPNLLLEPGSGVPDVKKILEKVRNGQQNSKRDSAPAGSSDVIAAARRAAQAAAAEAGAQKFVQPSAFKKDKEKKPSKSIFDGAQRRRPILLAAAAVLLVAMTYTLVPNLLGKRGADIAAPEVAQERALDIPADATNASTSEAPVLNDAAPVEAEKPAQDASTPVDEPPVDQSASDQMMAPAENADSASTLEKPVDAAPQPVDDAAAKNEVAPADASEAATVAADAKSADTKVAEVKTETPVDAVATAKAGVQVEPPAGLSPASLAEAVKKGDALAYFEVGARYTDGRSVKVDLAEAAKWYKLAADKGLAPAEYRLANFYEKGTGVERDIAKARALYTAAAEKGNASAMHNLAVLYATGVGGTPDFAQAAHWFLKAANLNVRDSQFNLAILNARGNGVPQDLEESYKWFAVAAREGDQDAAQKRDEVANALSPEQLKSAKAKLDLWKPKPMDDAANTPMVPDEWLAKGKTTASVDMKRAIRNIQAILNNNGFDAGKPDGEMGKKTVTAIKAFQKSVKLDPTGRIDDALVRELLKRNKAKS